MSKETHSLRTAGVQFCDACIAGWAHLEAAVFPGANTQGRLDIVNEGNVAWNGWRVACYATNGSISFSGTSGGSGRWEPGQSAAVIVNLSASPHGGASGTRAGYSYRCVLNVDARDISQSGTLSFEVQNR